MSEDSKEQQNQAKRRPFSLESITGGVDPWLDSSKRIQIADYVGYANKDPGYEPESTDADASSWEGDPFT